MEEQRQRKEKDHEKKELLDALSILAQRIGHTNSALYSYENIIYFAISDKADSSVVGIHNLHRDKKLNGYLKEIKRDGFDQNRISPTLIDDLIEITEPKIKSEATSVQRTPSSSVVSYRSSSHSARLFQPKVKPSISPSGAVFLCGLGGVGLTTALLLLGKSVMISTAAMTTAAAVVTTSAAFPPALIGIIALCVTAALFTATMFAIAAIKHYHNKKTRADVDKSLAENALKTLTYKA